MKCQNMSFALAQGLDQNGNLLIIDIDGESALNYCNKVGCLLNEIRLDNSEYRSLALKVGFRIKDKEFQNSLRFGKIVFQPVRTLKNKLSSSMGVGNVLSSASIRNQEAITPGVVRQKSFGPSEAWGSLIRDLIKTKQKKLLQKLLVIMAGLYSCPICGRTEPDCRIIEDGSFIQCHKD